MPMTNWVPMGVSAFSQSSRVRARKTMSGFTASTTSAQLSAVMCTLRKERVLLAAYALGMGLALRIGVLLVGLLTEASAAAVG